MLQFKGNGMSGMFHPGFSATQGREKFEASKVSHLP